MNIRPATTNDAAQIAEAIKSLLLELGDEKSATESLTADVVSKLMNTGKTSVFLAETEHGEHAGMISLTETQAIYAGGLYGMIDEMYVSPQYRSQNVGASLIAEAKKHAQRKGWKRLAVTAPPNNNERPLNFYTQNGFEPTGPKLKLKIAQ